MNETVRRAFERAWSVDLMMDTHINADDPRLERRAQHIEQGWDEGVTDQKTLIVDGLTRLKRANDAAIRDAFSRRSTP